MTPLAEAMFWLANALIVPVWGMMWFLPDHDLTKRYIGDLKLTFLPLLIPYLVLALPVLPDLLMTLGTQMPTPAVVVELFEDPDMVVLAWIHILALDTLAERFDHIEAMGVLHHLRDPMAGWQVLRGLLADGGTMRIGLYSRRGRTAIKAAQEIAQDFPRDTNGLRALRQAILALPDDHPASPVRRELDFYTLSGVRDALAHAQEHDYTLPEIAPMLAALDLRFLGFEFAAANGQAAYRKAHPDDPAMADLDRWDALEQANPSLFYHMYQFWCIAK